MRDEPFDSKLDSCEVSFDSPPSTLRVSFFFHHERLQQANFVWLTGFHSKSQDHLFIIDHHFVEMSLTHRKKPDQISQIWSMMELKLIPPVKGIWDEHMHERSSKVAH